MTTGPGERARPDSWKTRAMPQVTARLAFEAVYSTAEFDAVGRGRVPFDMDDKWFIFEKEGTVAFHRSWTGICIYLLRFEKDGARYRVAEARVNRDPEQYQGGGSALDEEYEAQLLHFLIDNLLLRRGTPFPLPATVADSDGPAFQHHISGTGYTPAPRKSAP